MTEALKEIIKIERKEEIKEEELFKKIKEFLGKEKTEYPSFALTTMIVDAMTSGSSIYKVEKPIANKFPIQENFSLV